MDWPPARRRPATDRTPFKTNVTITHTIFANNHVDDKTGGDIYIWCTNDTCTVPCPAPGKACDSDRCCFDGDPGVILF